MRFLIANCPVGLSQHRTSGEFIAASEACERLLGRSQTELVGLALFGLISDDAGERLRSEWAHVCATQSERQVRFQYVRPDGVARWLEATLRLAPAAAAPPQSGSDQESEPQILCCLQDVTAAVASEKARDARLAEAELAERHRDYLVRMTPGLVWFGPVSPDLSSYRAVYISEYLFRVTGYTAKQWMETPGFWRSIIHPEDRERIVQDAPTAMAEERPIGPYRIIANDGRILWIKSQILIERDAAGVPVRMHGLTLDMTSFLQAETEQVRLREALADQAQRLLELSTPLIPISEDVLVLPLIGTLDPARAQHTVAAVLSGVAAFRVRLLLVDLTGVGIVDPDGAAALLRMIRAVALLGAQAILTGLRAELAQALIRLGIDLSGVTTCASLRAAIAEHVITPSVRSPDRTPDASLQTGRPKRK